MTAAGLTDAGLLDRTNVLQLTDFHRDDTAQPNLTPDGERVIFAASADP
jgi:hypothetical protein